MHYHSGNDIPFCLMLNWWKRANSSIMRAGYEPSFVSYLEQNDCDIWIIHCICLGKLHCHCVNADSLSIRAPGTNFSEICIKIQKFWQAITFEDLQDVVYKMSAILSVPQSVNSLRPSNAYMHWQTNHHWFRLWLVAWSASSHYLNQCWNVVNWTLRNNLQWNFNRNSNIFFQENAFQNVIWKIAAIMSRPQCVKISHRH